MERLTNVYLIGLGAIGGMVASRLLDAGNCNLKVIVDAERRQRYTEDSVTINRKKYDFQYICPEDQIEPADLIIIAVKNHHLKTAMELICPFVASGTAILSLLNGIDSEIVLGREFGFEKLLYSFYVATDAVRIGTDIQYENVGRVVFGEKDKSISERVQCIRNLLESAGIAAVVPADILREIWWKFMMNVGVNQTSAILKAPYGVYQRSETARSLMRDACLEVVRIAEKEGIRLMESDIEQYFEIINGLSPEKKTSMLQDVEAFRKTEVEAFSGTVIRLGEEHGIATPVNDVLYKMIRVIEENYPKSYPCIVPG